MRTHESAARADWEAYWQGRGRQLSTDQLRTTCWMLLPLQGLFSCLDAIAFPELFTLFLVARMGVNGLLLWILFRLRFTHPKQCESLAALAIGAEILLMIYQTGGPTSQYYTGLILLSAGMPVLLPFEVRQATWIAGSFVLAFALSPIFAEAGFDQLQFATALVFTASGGVVCVVSSGLLMNSRLADFKQKQELESARDRLAALDEAKARFSANIHHELRTPLTLILAPLDAIRSGEFGEIGGSSQPGDGPGTIEQSLRTMYINGQRLLKMINNLLDLAKVESQSFEIHRRPVDLQGVLQDVVDGASGLAHRKGIALSLEASTGETTLNADPDALEKVVMNLIGNALKFTDSGGSIRIDVGTAAERVDGYDGVRVRVTDTGVGLAPDQLQNIFDRFSQVDSSATRKHEGTGIGLSLARELVELHGGRIWAESEGEGHGASMCFVLPIGEVDGEVGEDILCDENGRGVKLETSIQAVEADLGLPAEPGDRARFAEMERSVVRWEGERDDAHPESSPADSDEASRPEVLIVEDNPDMRDLLAMLVSREFRIRVACNGREALERVAEGLPDLVLTDVMMPEMSGTELCRALKGDPQTCEVPVILVTSKAESEMKVQGLELGADDYVTKPFHPRELMARVRSLVTQRCLRSELAARNTELEATLSELELAQVKLVQSERLAAVGELAAGIAHEVNNPVNFALNAVRAMKSSVTELGQLGEQVASLDWEDESKLAGQIRALHALEQELGVAELTETIGELAGIVAEGLTRTHTLVTDLRDFAAPGTRGERVRVDLQKALASTLDLLSHVLREGKAEVELESAEGLPQIQGDPGALNQVFLNLIKNAAESFEDRGGNIRIACTVAGENVRVAISDDGPGMSDAVVQRLFEPFFTTKETTKGTGLGLSICKQIAESHNGVLEVDSAAGEGTTMTLVLPVDAPAAADADIESNAPGGQDAAE